MADIQDPVSRIRAGGPDHRDVEIAEAVLRASTPLEREVLRRWYVLEESAEEIHNNLGVSVERIQEIRANARAAYRERHK